MVKESFIEPPAEFRPSAEVLTALEALRGANEIEFVEKAEQPEDVKWLIGVLMLLVHKESCVIPGDPQQTWIISKPFLQEQITLSGLGRLADVTNRVLPPGL